MEQVKSFEARPLGISDALVPLLGSIFLALLSQVSIPLPFTPVPLTLQTFGVFLLGGFLSPWKAGMSVMVYLIQGTCGIPVFAGGISNPLWLLDCKGGFLLSFLPAALCISLLMKKSPKKNIFYLLFCLVIGQMIIFMIGAGWLSFYVGAAKAVQFGVIPFISGAALKILLAASSLKGKGTFLCPK